MAFFSNACNRLALIINAWPSTPCLICSQPILLYLIQLWQPFQFLLPPWGLSHICVFIPEGSPPTIPKEVWHTPLGPHGTSMTSHNLGGPGIQRHRLITATNKCSVLGGIWSHSWWREGHCREHLHVCSEPGYSPGLPCKAGGPTLGHTAGRWHSWETKPHQDVATTLSPTLIITWFKLLAAQRKETF